MTRTLNKQMVLGISFLVIIVTPGIIQTAIELRGGESLQALNVFRQKINSKNLRAYEREMEDASWVAKQLRPLVQYAQFRLLRETDDKALMGRDGWMFYRPGFRYLTERPAPPSSAAPANNPLSAIVAFRDELAKRNIRLLVMIAPNKESVYPEMLTRGAVDLDVVVCPQTRRLLDDLQRARVEVVDLFDAYRAAKRGSGPASVAPLYPVQDSHWSPAGVEVAAKAVARKMLNAGWAQCGGVAYESRPMPVRRVGDVIRMLQVPQLERHVAPEDILCQQILQPNTERAYQDNPDSEVLVLGDSFLRIYQQDEPKSAGFVAHLARELQQPVASIINDGGASTLVRQELHRRPKLLANKKVVIWEFVERDIRFGTEGWQIVPLPNPFPSTAAAARSAGASLIAQRFQP
jgi:hypothetical protein